MSQRQGREASSRGFVPLCHLLNGVMSLFIFINLSLQLRRTTRFVSLLFGDNQESTVPCSYKAYKRMQNQSVIVEVKLTRLTLLAFSWWGFPLPQRATVQVQQTSPRAAALGWLPTHVLLPACRRKLVTQKDLGDHRKIQVVAGNLIPRKNHLWSKLTLLLASLPHAQSHLTAVCSWHHIKGGLLYWG